MHPSNEILMDRPAAGPSGPKPSFGKPPMADAGEEDDETKLLTEAADALEQSGAAAELVARIRGFLAEHGGEGIAAGATTSMPPLMG